MSLTSIPTPTEIDQAQAALAAYVAAEYRRWQAGVRRVPAGQCLAPGCAQTVRDPGAIYCGACAARREG